MKNPTQNVEAFLEKLRTTHTKLHKKYEDYFWTSYMGDHSIDTNKDRAQKERDDFYGNKKLKEKTQELLKLARSAKHKKSLKHWLDFFELNQTHAELVPIKDAIVKIETVMGQRVAEREEGYIDPYTNKFVASSYLQMAQTQRTHSDEKIRKACFEGREKLAETNLDLYIDYVQLLNQYARGLGFEDFYAFKLQQEEGMTKDQLFAIFDAVYEKTKYALTDIRELEKKQAGLREPWNFGYYMAGDFTKEEDPYFPFEHALERWGASFSAMGINFKGGKLILDLLDRKGKYSNGFCHWPSLVHYKGDKRIPGQANFTCNVVYRQVGAAKTGYETLFHEGGHAAHLLNTIQADTCLNHEYPPMSTAWAETQSMFLDTVFSSYEWLHRYAKNNNGESYPFDLLERKVKRLNVLKPLGLMGIIAVSEFEKRVYEAKNLDKAQLYSIAKSVADKYFDYSTQSNFLLNIPHIYSWTSACSYHAYGLADMAVFQWREYFIKKYGYIVDNPKVGTEMKKVWKHGAGKKFAQFIKEATGSELSDGAWTREHTQGIAETLTEAAKFNTQNEYKARTKKTDLDATIILADGKNIIADSKKGFETMARTYAEWLNARE